MYQELKRTSAAIVLLFKATAWSVTFSLPSLSKMRVVVHLLKTVKEKFNLRCV